MNPGTSAAGTQRVFVALWPTPAVRERLRDVTSRLAADALTARIISASNLHLTLAFIGSLGENRTEALAERLTTWSTTEFDWVIDHVGYFARARVVWAGGPQTPKLFALAASVRELLEELAVSYDRKPFAPHVTLLRDVAHWPANVVPIKPEVTWPCKRPTVIRSEHRADGVVYVPVGLH
jgi:2'-5' RNA ligase